MTATAFDAFDFPELRMGGSCAWPVGGLWSWLRGVAEAGWGGGSPRRGCGVAEAAGAALGSAGRFAAAAAAVGLREAASCRSGRPGSRQVSLSGSRDPRFGVVEAGRCGAGAGEAVRRGGGSGCEVVGMRQAVRSCRQGRTEANFRQGASVRRSWRLFDAGRGSGFAAVAAAGSQGSGELGLPGQGGPGRGGCFCHASLGRSRGRRFAGSGGIPTRRRAGKWIVAVAAAVLPEEVCCPAVVGQVRVVQTEAGGSRRTSLRRNRGRRFVGRLQRRGPRRAQPVPCGAKAVPAVPTPRCPGPSS